LPTSLRALATKGRRAALRAHIPRLRRSVTTFEDPGLDPTSARPAPKARNMIARGKRRAKRGASPLVAISLNF
jgi:hypothetical protein